MAMTKCKECGKEVSTSAKACPHCGVKNPGVSAKDYIGGTIILIAIVWGLAKCTGGDDEKTVAPKQTEAPKQTAAEKAAADAACMKDLQCWGGKHNGAAGIYCDDYVEKLAKYSHKWTDGIFESKFSHFRWKDKSKGYITYIGDKIKFQNGFGAWENYIYECDLNPETNTVVDVRAMAGRL